MWYLATLDRRHLLVSKTLKNHVKQESVHFIICPKQGPKMEGVVLHRVGILGLLLSQTGSGYQTLTGTLYTKWVKCPPPPPKSTLYWAPNFLALFEFIYFYLSLFYDKFHEPKVLKTKKLSLTKMVKNTPFQ